MVYVTLKVYVDVKHGLRKSVEFLFFFFFFFFCLKISTIVNKKYSILHQYNFSEIPVHVHLYESLG